MRCSHCDKTTHGSVPASYDGKIKKGIEYDLFRVTVVDKNDVVVQKYCEWREVVK